MRTAERDVSVQCDRKMFTRTTRSHEAICTMRSNVVVRTVQSHRIRTMRSHEAIRTIQPAKWYPQDGIRMMRSRDAILQCNPDDTIRTIQSHDAIPQSAHTIPRCNPHGVIRTMRSHATNNTIRTMQRAIPRSPSHNAIPQCHFTKQILMMQSHTTICSMRFHGNPHGEIAQPDIEVSASTKNKEKSHFSKLRKVVRTTETRVCTTETGISTDSDQSL